MVLEDAPYPFLFGNGDFKYSVETVLAITFQFGGNNLFICWGTGILNLVLQDWQLYFNSGVMVLVLKKCNAWSVKLYAFSVEET